MLRLFSECLRYLVQIENNYTATTELYKFKLGTEMTQLVDNFKKRHNLNDMKVDPSILSNYLHYVILNMLIECQIIGVSYSIKKTTML